MPTDKNSGSDGSLEQEQSVLDSIIKQVDAEARQFDDSMEWATNARTLAGIRAARSDVDTDRPYFGHFRAKNLETRSETFDLRIGLNGAQTKPQIVSWEAPIARAYHMRQGEPGESGKFSISDRREIEISNGEVTGIRNSYGFDNSSGSKSVVKVPKGTGSKTQQAPSGDEQSRLAGKLEKSRKGEFEHIVETIQQDQYTEISRSARGVLVLDGVAGSGKTMVGLHRVAYITSKEREQSERVDVSRVVFLSPTSDLLRWSTKLRKDLHIEQMEFSTISKFMWEWLQGVSGVVLDKIESHIDSNVQQIPSQKAVERAASSIANQSEIPEWLLASPKPLIVNIPYKREIEKRMNAADWDRFWSNEPTLAEGTLQIEALKNKPFIDLKSVRKSIANSADNNMDLARIRTVCDLLRSAQPQDITGDVLLLSVMPNLKSVHADLKRYYEVVVAVIKAASWGTSNSHYTRIAGVQIRFHDELFHPFTVPVTHVLQNVSADSSDNAAGVQAKYLSERNRFRANLLQYGQGFGNQFAIQARVGSELARRELDPKWKQIATNAIEQYVNRVWQPVQLSNHVLQWPIGYDPEEEGAPDRASLGVLCAAVIQNHYDNDDERRDLGHIVVDEAQELSEAEVAFLRAVSGNSLTLVGDSAQVMEQKTTADGRPAWIQERKDVQVIEFNRSYRTTAKVTEFCNEVLKLRGITRLAQGYAERPGQPVVVKACNSEEDQDRETTEWFKAITTGSSLIVVPEQSSAMMRNRMSRLLTAIDPTAEQKCRVMTPSEARGLEFDHVIVVNVDDKNYPNTEKFGAALYIACTRATATLTCTYLKTARTTASTWLPIERRFLGKWMV
jgi:DNA helicase IV